MLKISRKFVNTLFVILLLLEACTSGSLKDSEQAPPNIVVILTDDQGWGDLSVQGNIDLSTPHIDNLSRNGVTFDRFFVCPVCAPTRAEFLTGRYAARGGVFGVSEGAERLDLDETTIADLFKSAGYATAAYGKWHNGMQAPYHPNTRGFEDYYGFCSGHWGNYFDPMLEHNGKPVKGEGFIIDDLTNHGLDFMEQNKSNPFFLYLPFNTPHSPMQVPDTFFETFEGAELQMPLNKESSSIQKTRAALAMCENVDWNVGRVVAKLEELDLLENTIILYFSDNGPNGHRWNGEMKGIKGSTDEGGVRSPTFIQWKGTLEAGKKITEIAAAIDLLPTLTDLAGISFEPEKKLDGKSLKPLLLDHRVEWEERSIVHHWGTKTSVRNQNFRLDQKDQLFHMTVDPNQTTDVTDQFPQVYKQLKSVKEGYITNVLGELNREMQRPITIGYKEATYTQVPARDGRPHGGIERSNKYPNCSFFTNWTSEADKITWEVDILEEADYEIELFYTCPDHSVGTEFEFTLGDAKLAGKISKGHDPDLKGMENDRIPRIESYIKDFIPLKVGTIHLTRGEGTLSMQATKIPGPVAMDLRLLVFTKK
jgi:arylsulfatase A-like enzyme